MSQFREFTFINADQCEVMVDINPISGSIVKMYCYADHLPEIDNSETGIPYKQPTTTPSNNRLFVHIKNKSTTLKRMLIHGGFIVLLDDQDSEYNNEVGIIEKCLTRLKLPLDITPY